MAGSTMRLHIENARRHADIFHITEARWNAACARHRALARHLETSIGWDGDILEDALGRADMLIGVPARRDRLEARAPRLRWLHATSAGIDGLLPLDWLPRGVAFTNNRGAHGAKAREYMRMAYALLHTRMPEIISNQQRRHWEQLFSPSIVGRQALIVGLGDLGEAAARAGEEIGLRTIAVRRDAKKKCRYADAVHPLSRLDALLPEADFVVLAIPLTPETANLFDARRFGLMKPGAGFINISRAGVADYGALRAQLKNGRLAGAVVDVVEPEPLPSASPLWNAQNLVITPHISCDDGEHYIDITLDLWFENLARFLDEKPLLRRIDPQLGY